jgi:hypothetical protein
VLVVCLGIAVLCVAILALREPGGHVAAQRSASSVGKQSSTHPGVRRSSGHAGAGHSGDSHGGAAAKSVPLVVLNDTTVQGLAQQAAQRFRSGGWTVTSYGNYQNEIISTCAYYDPSVTGAKLAAEALQRQFPAIKRVKARFPELPNGPVVVVLTPDYTQS